MKKTSKKKKRVEFDYCKTFDRAMQQAFGEEFITEYSLLVGNYGNYVTYRKNGRKLTKIQAQVGAAISNAICETKIAFTD